MSSPCNRANVVAADGAVEAATAKESLGRFQHGPFPAAPADLNGGSAIQGRRPSLLPPHRAIFPHPPLAGVDYMATEQPRPFSRVLRASRIKHPSSHRSHVRRVHRLQTAASALAKAVCTSNVSHEIELAGSGFSPFTQSSESARPMRRFRSSEACRVWGGWDSKPTADGL